MLQMRRGPEIDHAQSEVIERLLGAKPQTWMHEGRSSGRFVPGLSFPSSQLHPGTCAYHLVPKLGADSEQRRQPLPERIAVPPVALEHAASREPLARSREAFPLVPSIPPAPSVAAQ